MISAIDDIIVRLGKKGFFKNFVYVTSNGGKNRKMSNVFDGGRNQSLGLLQEKKTSDKPAG